jgi:hypothetical protein
MPPASNLVVTTAESFRQYTCVQVFGGLGNQMFQYAAGYAQAKRLGTGLLVDPVDSERLDHARYGLGAFALDTAFWSPDPRSGGLLTRLLGRPKAKKRFKAWPGPLYRHQGQPYDDAIAAIGPGTYLAGYFQSERFFAAVADDIRSAFSLDHMAASFDQALIDEVVATPHVAVHIRRGDYASDPRTTATHGLAGPDYYERAHRLMQRLAPDARYLVFSDDPAAAAEMTADWPDRRLAPGTSREEDLHLMRLCRHHIIANSTFSWWGAWLADADDKTVIAPRRWFARARMLETFTDDICPEGWILV